jgi:ABC-type Fe3+-hydroxamate transport system substrate-binding protein
VEGSYLTLFRHSKVLFYNYQTSKGKDMKKTLLTTLTIGTLLLFTACGSESKSSSESVESKINNKEFIIIVQHQGSCTLSEVKQNIVNISNNLTVPRTINSDSLITVSEKNSVTCETYDRTYDDVTCEMWDFDEPTKKSCTIGLDFKK